MSPARSGETGGGRAASNKDYEIMIPQEARTGLKRLKFYENWWLMAESRDTDEKRLAFYDAIMRYAFNGVVPETPTSNSPSKVWAAWDGFNVCKPLVDGIVDMLNLHEMRTEAGRLGGLAGRGISKLQYEDLLEKQTEKQTEKQNEKQKLKQTEKQTEATLINKKENKNKKENTNIENNTGGVVSGDDMKTMFEAWWKSYPGFRKQDKRKCFEKFARILKSSKDAVSMFNTLMNGIERWKRSDTWMHDDGRYICAPLVWLNNERWEAEISAVPSRKSSIANIHHDPNAEVENAF